MIRPFPARYTVQYLVMSCEEASTLSVYVQ